MKKKRIFSLVSLVLMPLTSQAIGIDAMIKFTENAETNFTIANPAKYRQFLQVAISRLEVVNGEIVDTPYTRDNLDEWSLAVRPTRTVIDPNMSKTFQVNYDFNGKTTVNKDKMYRLTFVPTPYFADGEPKTHSVQIATGFAPVVVVPAEQDKPLQFQMSYSGDNVMLKNQGETYIRAFLNTCSDEEKKDVKMRRQCSKVVYALAGRHLPIPLTERMKKSPSMKIELSTHRSTYKENFTLKRDQVVSDGM